MCTEYEREGRTEWCRALRTLTESAYELVGWPPRQAFVGQKFRNTSKDISSMKPLSPRGNRLIRSLVSLSFSLAAFSLCAHNEPVHEQITKSSAHSSSAFRFWLSDVLGVDSRAL